MEPSLHPPSVTAALCLVVLLGASVGRAAPPPTAAASATTAPPPPTVNASAAAPAPAPAAAEGEGSDAEAELEAEEQETGRALSAGDRMLRALSDKLYDTCVKRDTLACLGLKAFYATARFAEAPEALAQVSARRARLREATADRVLVGSAAALLSSSLRQARETLAANASAADAADDDAQTRESDPTDAPTHVEADDDDVGTDRRRTGFFFTRKMLFPLLIGVVLKLASLIPLVLGKLTLMGTMSLMSSKMSLLILMLMSLRRWLSGGGESGGGNSQMVSETPYYSQQPHAGGPPPYPHGYDAHAYETQAHPLAAPTEYAHPHHMHAVPASPLHGPYRRVYRTYQVVRGRQLGDAADWAPRAEQQKADTSADESNSTTVSPETPTQLSRALAATEAPPPTQPSATAASTVTVAAATAAEPSPAPAGPVAAAPSSKTRKRDHEEGSATSGFSVSQEDVESEVRRLDEVEGKLEGH